MKYLPTFEAEYSEIADLEKNLVRRHVKNILEKSPQIISFEFYARSLPSCDDFFIRKINNTEFLPYIMHSHIQLTELGRPLDEDFKIILLELNITQEDFFTLMGSLYELIETIGKSKSILVRNIIKEILPASKMIVGEDNQDTPFGFYQNGELITKEFIENEPWYNDFRTLKQQIESRNLLPDESINVFKRQYKKRQAKDYENEEQLARWAKAIASYNIRFS